MVFSWTWEGGRVVIVAGQCKASNMQLADLNDDCTIALLKRISSAQLFTFISSPEFSNRRLRDCAMVALKDIYTPFSLKSSINADGTYAVYVADAKNGNMAVLKHPDLFQHSPLSEFLDKADIHLSAKFDPADLQAWLDLAQSIPVSNLQLSLSYTCLDTPPRVPSARQLMQAFSSVRSLCISARADPPPTVSRDLEKYTNDDNPQACEITNLLDTIGVGLLQKQLGSLIVVCQPAQCIPVALSRFLKLHLLLLQYLPRSADLESVDLCGLFITSTRAFFSAPFPGEDPRACELLLCELLTGLRSNRTLKCIKLRCRLGFISFLQEKLPEDCKIVELNGEPVLSDDILKNMHCSPDKIVIVQNKPADHVGGLREQLYLHIDCVVAAGQLAMS